MYHINLHLFLAMYLTNTQRVVLLAATSWELGLDEQSSTFSGEHNIETLRSLADILDMHLSYLLIVNSLFRLL